MASSDHQDMANTLSGIMGQFCNAATQQDFDAAMADWNEVYQVAETMGLYQENCDIEDESAAAEERIKGSGLPRYGTVECEEWLIECERYEW